MVNAPVPRVPFSAGPSSTRCSSALFAIPGQTCGSWPKTREGSNWARFGGTAGRRAALSVLAGEGIGHGHVRRRLPIHDLG